MRGAECAQSGVCTERSMCGAECGQSGACAKHVRSVCEACAKRVRSVCKACAKHVRSMYEACTKSEAEQSRVSRRRRSTQEIPGSHEDAVARGIMYAMGKYVLPVEWERGHAWTLLPAEVRSIPVVHEGQQGRHKALSDTRDAIVAEVSPRQSPLRLRHPRSHLIVPLLQLLDLTANHHVPERGAEHVRCGACAVRSGHGAKGRSEEMTALVKELVSEQTNGGIVTKGTPLPVGDRGRYRVTGGVLQQHHRASRRRDP